jgi:hypothetical protein
MLLLRTDGRSDGAIGVGTRRLLIVCEVALALVLLMGAGVMVQSLLALRHGAPASIRIMSSRWI